MLVLNLICRMLHHVFFSVPVRLRVAHLPLDVVLPKRLGLGNGDDDGDGDDDDEDEDVGVRRPRHDGGGENA